MARATRGKRSLLLWHATAWFACWTLCTGSLQPSELGVGLLAALVATRMSLAAVRAEAVRFRWVPSVLRAARLVPAAIVVGTARLFVQLARAALGRPLDEEVVAVEFDAGPEQSAAETRRALAIALATLSPDAIVIGFDGSRILLHRLGRGDPGAVIKQLEAPR